MDFEKQEYEKQLQSWKRRRAEADVPADFADKVMASVEAAGVVRHWVWLQRARAVFARSRLLQTAVYVAAVVLLVLRLAALFAIFVPAS